MERYNMQQVANRAQMVGELRRVPCACVGFIFTDEESGVMLWFLNQATNPDGCPRWDVLVDVAPIGVGGKFRGTRINALGFLVTDPEIVTRAVERCLDMAIDPSLRCDPTPVDIVADMPWQSHACQACA